MEKEKYVQKTVFKGDLATQCNDMDKQGYDFVCIVNYGKSHNEQNYGAIHSLEVLYKRRDSSGGDTGTPF